MIIHKLLRASVQRTFHYSSALPCVLPRRDHLKPVYAPQTARLFSSDILLEPKNFLQRVGFKLFPTNIKKARLKYTGHLHYEHIVDTIDYSMWFKEFQLSDTFHSWFVVTELHVWMLMVKAMGEGEDGKMLRTFIVETLWGDTSERVKKLKSGDLVLVRKHVNILHEQFFAAIFAYDEGLLCSDIVLASALWRRFFNMSCDDPLLIERMIKYIRIQIQLLDSIPKKDLFERKMINWVPLKNIVVDSSSRL